MKLTSYKDLIATQSLEKRAISRASEKVDIECAQWIEASEARLRVNSINCRGSVCDGPGLRTVLFLQGCSRRCDGCHNPQTWSFDGGIMKTVTDLVKELIMLTPNKKVTISGGEPLDQLKGVLALIRGLKDFDIALYTGYGLEYVPPEILRSIKYLKVGPFKKNNRVTCEPYIGSSNQEFFHIGVV